MKSKRNIITIVSIFVLVILVFTIITIYSYKNNHQYSYNNDDFYSYEDDDIYCTVNLENQDKKYYDKSLEEYLKSSIYITLNDKVSEVIKNETKNIEFMQVKIETDSNEEYYYAFETKNNYYLLKYRITDYKNGDRSDIDTNICYTAKDKILSSIQIKN